MIEGLQKTKFFASPPRRNLVTRPRRLDKLAEVIVPEIRLTLICASAGFGKTTVVTEWLSRLRLSHHTSTSQPGFKSAWLILDEIDNDPIRFSRFVDAALQPIDPWLGESNHPVLNAPQPPPFRTLVAELANDLLTVGPVIEVSDAALFMGPELGLAYEFHGDSVTATKLLIEAENDMVVTHA